MLEFEILFISHKTIKGQVIVDYLVEYLMGTQKPFDLLFLDEVILMLRSSMTKPRKLFFDGAANSTRSGVGAILILSKGQ